MTQKLYIKYKSKKELVYNKKLWKKLSEKCATMTKDFQLYNRDNCCNKKSIFAKENCGHFTICSSAVFFSPLRESSLCEAALKSVAVNIGDAKPALRAIGLITDKNQS